MTEKIMHLLAILWFCLAVKYFDYNNFDYNPSKTRCRIDIVSLYFKLVRLCHA